MKNWNEELYNHQEKIELRRKENQERMDALIEESYHNIITYLESVFSKIPLGYRVSIRPFVNDGVKFIISKESDNVVYSDSNGKRFNGILVFKNNKAYTCLKRDSISDYNFTLREGTSFTKLYAGSIKNNNEMIKYLIKVLGKFKDKFEKEIEENFIRIMKEDFGKVEQIESEIKEISENNKLLEDKETSNDDYNLGKAMDNIGEDFKF